MDKEEIKAYLKKVDELGKKLVGQDKDTFDWMIFGYNQCAKILHEKEMIIEKAVEYINKNIAIYHKQLPLIAIDYEEVINILKGGDTNDNK